MEEAVHISVEPAACARLTREGRTAKDDTNLLKNSFQTAVS